MSSPQARRRQRSTRLVVAVVLIVVAALAVAGAVLSGSWTLLTAAAVLGVVLGAVAARITHSELMQTRRDAARDRAEQAQAYRELTEARAAEHAEFSASMRSRVEHQEIALAELELALTSAQKRAAEAARKFNAEARRADAAERDSHDHAARLEAAEERAATATIRVAELEQEIDAVRSELAGWQAEPYRKHA
jgi:uncharacterized membrane-anchored protein YhcB (DUF1043 family)